MAQQVVSNVWNQDLVVVNSNQSNNNNLQTVSSANFENQPNAKPLRGKGRKWNDLETFDTYELFENSEFFKNKISEKIVVKHRDRNGVQNYVCRYKKKKGFSCDVEYRVIADDGKFRLQEPVDQSEHSHDQISERKYENYTEMDKEMTKMIKNEVKTNKMAKSLKEQDLCPQNLKRSLFYSKVNRLKKKLKLNQVNCFYINETCHFFCISSHYLG